jgi:type VI secretion system protein ImpH
MADEDGRSSADLAALLAADPEAFEFFQAVRLLEWIQGERARRDSQIPAAPVGDSAHPDQEIVRFRAPATTGFPGAEIAELNPPAHPEQPWEMTVAFLGLIGPSGVLPQHYTAEAIDRARAQDGAYEAFLNIFQHRATSLFFRAFRKYRYPWSYEHQQHQQQQSGAKETAGDLFTFALRSLAGLGLTSLANRMHLADATVLYYAGHFSHAVRPAISLERMLEDYFGFPAQVQQFHGRWITLPPSDQTRTPTAANPRGQYCQLGIDAMIGPSVWNVQTMFRVRLGPMDYRSFQRFLPRGEAFAELVDLVRLYAGYEYEFDVQPVLRREAVPPAKCGDQASPTFLGWNSWLPSGARAKDADEAIFQPPA